MKLSVIGFRGGYPGKDEASSGYLLEHDHYCLLIDCGSAVLSQLQRVLKPQDLDAVILSHYHPDHMADIGVLQHARLIQGFLGQKLPTLPIYGHDQDRSGFQQLTYKDITQGIAYKPEKSLQVGAFSITFLQTSHPAICYAMRIEVDGKVLVYTADTSFTEELVPFAQGANILLCECNLYKGQNGQAAGHMTSEDAGILAEKARVHSMILTHLPHFGDVTQLVQEAKEHFDGPTQLAYSGLTVNL